MRRILVAPVLLALLLVGCADHPSPGGASTSPPTPSNDAPRVDVYETMIRYLVNPQGAQPITVRSDLCFELMPSTPTCPDHLSHQEQTELGTRLQDLGDIVFTSNHDSGKPLDGQFQEILLSPIVEKADGLRVEGGAVCGNLCGNGSVYILMPTDGGYEVTGTDNTYGSWVS